MRYLSAWHLAVLVNVVGCSGGGAGTAADLASPAETVIVRKVPLEEEPAKKSGVKKALPPVTPIVISDVDEPPPTEIPKIVMSAGHEKSSLIKVGDPFPDAELANIDGQKQKLSSLRGAKATVVLCWTEKQLFAQEALTDMPSHIVAPFEKSGVKVIAINVGSEAPTVKKASDKVATFFPVLLDPKREFFAKLATEKLPRIYVLDGAGKVVWFDIEYGRTVRRELRLALRFLISPPKRGL